MNSCEPTLTCSPASGDLALPPIGLDSAPSHSLKSAPMRAACLPTTGPECRILEASPSSAGEPTIASNATTTLFGASDATLISATANASKRMNSPNVSEKLTFLRAACLASLQACSVPGVELLTPAGCGLIPSESSASFDPATASLRTRQLSLLSKTGEPSTELYQDWPRSGMWDGTTFFPLPPLVQDIAASVSSSLLPTPRAGKVTMEEEESWAKRNADGKVSTRPLGLAVKLRLLPTPRASASETRSTKRTPFQEAGKHGKYLQVEVIRLHLLPTATARDWKDSPNMALERKDGTSRIDQLPRRLFADLNATTGYKLNPQWTLWFMGYPINWLKPLYDALATPSCRKSSSPSSTQSEGN